MSSRLTLYIVVAMVAGLIVGAAVNALAGPPAVQAVAAGLDLVTDAFLRLIRMLIAPLVFATLTGGVAHLGGGGGVGRLSLSTFGWFLAASLASLAIGGAAADLLRPGVGLRLAAGAAAASETAPLTAEGFLHHLIPTSAVAALADNEILQVVVVSLLFGAALSALGERTAALRTLVDQLAQVVLRVVDYVMRLAPLAVFAALASAVALRGPGLLVGYAGYIGAFYLALAVLWALMLGVAALRLGARLGPLLRALRQPVVLAFTTTSSEAAFPLTLEALLATGVRSETASFVLPLGYSFNLCGSMIYASFAVLFIAQAYGIALPPGRQAALFALLLVSSKGIAGVPRAVLVVVAAALAAMRLPAAGLALILAVDHLLDMGRSATNVLGNALVAAMVDPPARRSP